MAAASQRRQVKQAAWAKAYIALLRDPNLSLGARLTLVLLRSYCGSFKDVCWPSTELLCAGLGCDRKALFRYLAELQTYGCLRRSKRLSKFKSFTSTKYTLLDERKAISKLAFPCSQNGDAATIRELPVHKYATAKHIRRKIIQMPCPQNGHSIQKHIDIQQP